VACVHLANICVMSMYYRAPAQSYIKRFGSPCRLYDAALLAYKTQTEKSVEPINLDHPNWSEFKNFQFAVLCFVFSFPVCVMKPLD